MNREFIDALGQLAQERNLNRDELLVKFEEALEQAYSSKIQGGSEVEGMIDPETGAMEVLLRRKVVDEVVDPVREISLEEALELDDSVELGMEMEFPVDTENFTRIAIQTTKQMITQKIKEAELSIVYEEYKDRAGDVLSAVVSRTDNKRNVFVDLGRGEAILPPKEQIPGERYMVGMRLRVYVVNVELSARGPSILVSRAAPELLEYLMKQEIPEVADGTVELKAIAREAGQRSKVAVTSTNPNVDPIGACIGHRGSRIQAVTSELQRERVDIIMWDPNPREFIRNALSPAKVGLIEIDTDSQEAKVTVGSDQLSLAIGKGGQNVRLAAKLTGFKIDLAASESVSDLDAAMQAAASRTEDPVASETSRAAFDALFAGADNGGDDSEADVEAGAEGAEETAGGREEETAAGEDAVAEEEGSRAS